MWLADQSEPVKRKVAVKFIKPGWTRNWYSRSSNQNGKHWHCWTTRTSPRCATADWPPKGAFFVMELVKGVPITKYCYDRKLTPRERLELFVPVCQAIQHAHQKWLIHRGIKPSNVLVAL